MELVLWDAFCLEEGVLALDVLWMSFAGSRCFGMMCLTYETVRNNVAVHVYFCALVWILESLGSFHLR